jgi:hypothetical protein
MTTLEVIGYVAAILVITFLGIESMGLLFRHKD